MPIFGVDVSHHQPALNFVQMKREGIEFAIFKASEGATFVDSDFIDNVARANAAGMLVAAYHYVRSNSSARAQAQHVRNIVPSWMPVIPDVEHNSGQIQLVRDFVAELRRLGYHVPLTYLPLWYWRDHMGRPDLRGLPPLWSSRYPDNQQDTLLNEWADVPANYWNGYGGLEVAMLQFTSSARIAGYGPLDANAYRGSLEGLKTLLGYASPQPVETPMEEEDGMKTFYVRGDDQGQMGESAPAGYEATKWGDAVFIVEATADGMKRRHISADEWKAAETAGAKVSVHNQAWVDSIPWGAQEGLWPWMEQTPETETV